jgi:hypothetical protein
MEMEHLAELLTFHMHFSLVAGQPLSLCCKRALWTPPTNVTRASLLSI